MKKIINVLKKVINVLAEVINVLAEIVVFMLVVPSMTVFLVGVVCSVLVILPFMAISRSIIRKQDPATAYIEAFEIFMREFVSSKYDK